MKETNKINDLAKHRLAVGAKMMSELDMLRKQNATLRMALEFYADAEIYPPILLGCAILCDGGHIARNALEVLKDLEEKK